MKNKILVTFLTLGSILNWNCTDLDEERIDEAAFGAQAETISGAIAPAYGFLSWTWRHTHYFGLQEISSDEAILPYRGGTDWYDGGKFIAAHQHNFTPSNDLVGQTWNQLTTNISRTLSAIEVLTPLAEEGNSEAEGALYEMKAMRAYLNMLMLDSWGIVFKKESSDALSEVLRTDEAIAYIESELLSVADLIQTNSRAGRINQNTVWGFLARLYLNAAVYRDPYGTPSFIKEDMDKVIEYGDKVINSGKYSLSAEYFDLFSDNNTSNPELIFALDQRGVLKREHSRWTYWSQPGSMLGRPEFYPDNKADGTDGPGVSSDFYQTWVDAYGSVDPADADARFYMQQTFVPDAQLTDFEGREKVVGTETDNSYFCIQDTDFEVDRGILRGIQWGPRIGDGALEKCDDGSIRIYPLKQIKGNGPDRDTGYVDFTLQIDFTNEGSLHHTGYRFSKYQFSHTSPNANGYSSIDLVLMRLAEIYMMRAEAKLRNGDNGGALADVNTVRTSRTARPDKTPGALSAIDLDIIFRELGFEFYWEGLRRTNQIRFGKYEDAWTEKSDTDVNHRLFPIPQSAVDGASGIDGFLEQNQGY